MAFTLHLNIDDLHIQLAHHIRSEYGVPVGLTLTLAKLETDCGASLSRDDYNIFNLNEMGTHCAPGETRFVFRHAAFCYNALAVMLVREEPYAGLFRAYQRTGDLRTYINAVVAAWYAGADDLRDKLKAAKDFYKTENISQFDISHGGLNG